MALIPFDDRDGQIWYDGKMMPWRDAKLHVLSHGLHYASSIFEGERAYAGHIFKLRAHTERLFNSARLLGFEIPYTVEEIDDACKQVIAANGMVDAYVRPVAWRGSEMMAVAAQQSKIHVAIATWAWPAMYWFQSTPTQCVQGLSACVCPLPLWPPCQLSPWSLSCKPTWTL